MALADVFDAAMDRFDDIVDRMRYHTTGEQPPDDWGGLNFYSIDLERELSDALAKECDREMCRLTRHLNPPELITEPGSLIQPVVFKLILPAPPVPVYRHFITEIPPEDLRRHGSP